MARIFGSIGRSNKSTELRSERFRLTNEDKAVSFGAYDTHSSSRTDCDQSFRRISSSALSSSRTDSDLSSGHIPSPGTIRELGKAVVDASGSSRRSKIKERLKSATCAQLRLSNLKLHGREADKALLKDKLSNIGNIGCELILVAGVSGVGKSALVKQGLQNPAEKRGTAFVSVKFDLNNNAQSFSAFAQALSGLAKHIMVQPNVLEIKSHIRGALEEDDMVILSSAMQGCEDLFTLNKKSSHFDLSQTGGKEAVSRLKYAIRRLLRVICSNLKRGAVIFIDDLQWSDPSSLDLLQLLVQDEENPSLLLVGAYRDNEVSDSHPLSFQIKEAERSKPTVTTIKLGNLEQSHVQTLVAEALGMEDEQDKVQELAEIVHKKTEGNCFFVIFFLRSLYDDELLQYNFAIATWRWDEQRIKNKVMTENVASMMVNKLRRFQKSDQHIIKVASCLGASFHMSVLEAVVQHKSNSIVDEERESIDSSAMAETISMFEEEGLWEQESSKAYNFCHDVIQSAALELVPTERRNSLKGYIGGVLMKTLDPDTFDRNLFQIVGLRNCSSHSLSEDDRIELAFLNVKAGLKASNNAAFDTAVVFFGAARDLLGSNAWDTVDSDRLIELYSKEAQARFVLGDLSTMEMLVEEVLSKDLPIKKVFEACEVKILAAQAANRFDEAISVALEVRRHLGFKAIPTRPWKATILREFHKTNKAVKGRSAEELAALPTLMDDRVAMGQRMLELLCTSTYQGNPSMFPLISFRAVMATIKYGINRSSCDGLVTYGVLLTGLFGDPKRGREMGQAAELIAEKHGMKMMKSRVLFHVHGLNYHNTSPLLGTLGPMLEGCQAGLETGDIESACWNLCFRSCYLWFASSPLEDISCELRTSVGVLNQMNQVGTMMCVLPYFQAAQNLCGKSVSDHPWVLSGDDFDFKKALDFSLNIAKNQMLSALIIVGQLDLFVVYQKWTLARDLLIKGGNLRRLIPGFFQAVRFTFLEGLVSLKTAQASASWREKRKWTVRAKKSMQIMRSSLKKGNVNIVHTLHLLTAEYHLLNGKNEKAQTSFKEAQISAKRTGFVQDRALAHELAGLHYMKLGDDYWAKNNMYLAHTAYMDWQAKAKARHLQSKYPHFF